MQDDVGAVATAAAQGAKPKHYKPTRSEVFARSLAVLKVFDQLPDSQAVDIEVIAAHRGDSLATVWRDVARGVLPKPKKFGSRSRILVGEYRAKVGIPGPIQPPAPKPRARRVPRIARTEAEAEAP
jgi:predicted DNA-binding transcriptional regulator AlpA